MFNTATRRLINREAARVARAQNVTPTLGFLALVRSSHAENVAEGWSTLTSLADVARTAYCVADCFQPHPTCTDGVKCDGCAAAIADGVVKGY